MSRDARPGCQRLRELPYPAPLSLSLTHHRQAGRWAGTRTRAHTHTLAHTHTIHKHTTHTGKG